MNEIAPQYPWAEGDRLFASALNAAIANGPYLGNVGWVNVLDCGADPTGVADSSAAFNTAASRGSPDGGHLRSVYVPAGIYRINHQVTLTDGQGLFGDSQGNSTLMIDSNFDPAATSVIYCAGSIADPGPTIRDLCIWFLQPSDATSRSTFKTLAAGGTSGTGGTGVQYPWAISTQHGAGGGRVGIYRVRIQGAWNGIDADACCYWIDGLQIGALNIGIAIGGTIAAQVLDWSHLSNVEFWTFGLGAGTLVNVYMDGNTVAMRIGAMNGLKAQNIDCFASQIIFTNDAQAGWFQFTNLSMDGGQSRITVNEAFFLQFTNLYYSSGAEATGPGINILGGNTVVISNFYAHTSVAPYPVINAAGATVSVTNARISTQTPTQTTIVVTGGLLQIANSQLVPASSAAWTVPLIVQNNTGNLQVTNLDLYSGYPPSGIGVQFNIDNRSNILGNVTLSAGWSNQVVPGPPYVGIYSGTVPQLQVSNQLAVFGAAAFAGGIICSPATGSGPTDLTKQICLYAGAAYGFGVTASRLNYNVPANATHMFLVGGVEVGELNNVAIVAAGALVIGGPTGPSWTQGTTAPAGVLPVGSLYSRVGGAVGATLYVSRGGGTWNAIAGV